MNNVNKTGVGPGGSKVGMVPLAPIIDNIVPIELFKELKEGDKYFKVGSASGVAGAFEVYLENDAQGFPRRYFTLWIPDGGPSTWLKNWEREPKEIFVFPAVNEYEMDSAFRNVMHYATEQALKDFK